MLKRAAEVSEEGNLPSSLSVLELRDSILDAGLILNISMEIGRRNWRPYDLNATQEWSPPRKN